MNFDWIFKPQSKVFGPDGSLSWESYDALKGFLIVLIVLGHNTLLVGSVPYLDWVLYNFHVGAFLLLPFLFSPDEFKWPSIRDKLVRYLWPYLVFVCASFLLYYFIYWAKYDIPTLTVLGVLANGLLSSNALALKSATGFALFWFLPALTSLLIIRSFVCSLPSNKGLVALIVLMISLVVIFYSDIRVDYVPFGLVIALYMLPVGLGSCVLVGVILKNRHQFTIMLLAVVVFVFLQWLSIVGETRINVGSNDFQQYEPMNIILLHFALQVTGFVLCLLLSRYMTKIPFLQMLGKHSLLIYLSHSLIYQALLRVFNMLGVNLSDRFEGSIIFVITLILSASFSLFVYNHKLLRDLLSPRDLETLKSGLQSGLRFGKAKA